MNGRKCYFDLIKFCVNCSFSRLQENGIISHWGLSMDGANSKFMRPYFTNFGTATEGPKKISIQNLSGAFWLLLIGLGVAAIALIYENLVIKIWDKIHYINYFN